MKLIAITCPSFSGSTILGLVLDGLKGVQFVGETHWIERGRRCEECDRALCPIFDDITLDRLNKVSGTPEWWEIMADASGADVIVSSDKCVTNFTRHLYTPDFVIQPYKDPRAYVWSYITHTYRAYDRPLKDEEIDEGIDYYVKWSNERLNWWIDSIPGVTLSLERFTATPGAELRGLCEVAGLPYNPDAVRYWHWQHHHIGGNFSAARRNVDKAKNHYFHRIIRPDIRYHDWISYEQKQRIMNDVNVKQIYERLKNKDYGVK